MKRAIGALGVLVLAACAHVPVATLSPTLIDKPSTAPTTLVLTARTARVGGQEVKIGLPPLTVWLVAEVKGPPTERLYCPEIVWLFPDDTQATEESDCLAWEEAEAFPRRWAKGLLLGRPGLWHFAVEARRGTEVLSRRDVQVQVFGDVSGLIASEQRAQ